jgi:small subunit ribosomal protein S6
MSIYESTFIVRQDVASAEINKIAESLSNLIKENGGELLKQEYWGLRDLAYEIRKNKKGHYIMLIIEAPYRAMQELQKKIKLSEDIIRSLSVKIESFDGKDSIMLTSLNREKNA